MCAAPAKGPGPAHVAPAGPRRTGLTIKQTRRRLRGLRQGVGPGLLGWRSECLRLFPRSDACVRDLFALVDAVAGARGPGRLTEIVAWSRVTPLTLSLIHI
eukprot:7785107-Alexandrium_andersonii.AAC.1